VSSAPASPLAALQDRLGHTFQDPRLLQRALTHPSILQDTVGFDGNNQRLEFLGDAVLQLVLSHELYDLFPLEREGGLSRRRAVLANGTFLAALAREAGIADCLKLGASEETTGGRNRTSSLEDAFEAVIGAIYLDGGLAAAKGSVLRLYGDVTARLQAGEPADNPKGRLQEIVQPSHGNLALRYELVSTEGEDHARIYEIAVSLHDRRLGTGRGTSKKLAEEAAARAALETMKAVTE
jgi:ribonuclease-3